MKTKRTLLLLRHAKSSWQNPNWSDSERPLNQRGRRAASDMAEFMRHHGLIPQLALYSPAKRTTETINIWLQKTASETEPQPNNDLYLATPTTIAKIIEEVPSSIRDIMIVGHNPGLEQLAQKLCSHQNHEMVTRLHNKYPTAGLACFEAVATDWRQFLQSMPSLTSFTTPSQLMVSNI